MHCPPTLLHIDSDAYTAFLLHREAGSWPFVRHIGIASDGSEGIHIAREREPDLVILELMLADMDGFSLIEKLGCLPRKPAIIVFTSITNEYSLYRIKRLHIGGVVWKTWNGHEQLAAAIQCVVGGGIFLSLEAISSIQKFNRDPNAFWKIMSEREISLLPLFGIGLSDLDASLLTGLKPGTIHSHRQRIMLSWICIVATH